MTDLLSVAVQGMAGDCAHEIPRYGCSYCRGTDSTRETPRRPVRQDATALLPRRRPRSIAEMVAAREVCTVCLRRGLSVSEASFAPIGCQCSRSDLFGQEITRGADFMNGARVAMAVDERRSDRIAVSAHLAAYRRGARRAGLLHRETNDPNPRPVMAADAAAIREIYGLDPAKARWVKPRTDEPDILPI